MTCTEPGTAAPLQPAPTPVRRWQRVQWQYAAHSSGSIHLELDGTAEAVPGQCGRHGRTVPAEEDADAACAVL